MKYDFLIVGSGIYGSTFAEQLHRQNKTCLVIDKKNHIGGNCYTENINGIDVHKYGSHIFHTNNQQVWKYINQFSEFNNYRHKVKVKHEDKIYSFPINLFTMYQVWGVSTPEEARIKLEEVRIPYENPKNMEEWCLSEIGRELYEIFIKDYSTKQWGKNPKELPASIVKRIPIYLSYNDDYYKEAQYQGIPKKGYTEIIKNMLDGIKVELDFDFFKIRNKWKDYANNLIFCGPLDQFFQYEFGKLEYRSLTWDHHFSHGDHQGCSVINYNDLKTKYTRAVEHKHFNNKNQESTIISYEYPASYEETNDPYYQINDQNNNEIHQKYKKALEFEKNILISGRLGKYKYMDMDDCIALAIKEVSCFQATAD
jgi:UDP-galactopyranose mutase